MSKTNERKDMKKLTKEEALKKIEELKKYVDDQDVKETKTIGFAIKHWNNSAQVIYQSTKETQREAVLEAVESGANLHDADLSGADLRGADLRGAELNCAKFYGIGGTKPLKRSQLPDFLAALGFVIED